MPLSDFDYELPPELIAQAPAQERTSSRLLLIDSHAQQQAHQFSHHRFANLPSLLPPQSLLVLNDTRVVPARLQGHKETGGKIEVLLVRREPGKSEVWEVLCKGGQHVQAGARVEFSAELQSVWQTKPEAGRGNLEFFPQGDFRELLEQYGEMPLPPYIKRQPGGREEDRERYQTVYARSPGAVAAPTAGLHFTNALMQTLHQQGIETVFLTLHVGIGTFQPVRVNQVETHRMEKETFFISQEAAWQINQAKSAGEQHTQLFIYPGFRFQLIDGLITNFHLPRSTLLMLVSALAGRERILNAYAEAVVQRYRFYSYGDAMLIV